jgi:hypothetical protein
VFLQINMVKYNVDWEITNIYENLQKVWSHFFTNMLLFVNIWFTSNIYWFIGIQIHCQQIQMNNYSFTFDHFNIQSDIQWAIMNVILNYLMLPSYEQLCDFSKNKMCERYRGPRCHLITESDGWCSPMMPPYLRRRNRIIGQFVEQISV